MYPDTYPDHRSGPVLKDSKASDTAQQALIMATKAMVMIEAHEKTCGRRWSLLTKLILLVLAKLGALLVFLLSDKMGWLI